jgi:hypothetical protein
MPDDQPYLPRREPERIDLGAIKTDLEFLMERLSKLPTRKELVQIFQDGFVLSKVRVGR